MWLKIADYDFGALANYCNSYCNISIYKYIYIYNLNNNNNNNNNNDLEVSGLPLGQPGGVDPWDRDVDFEPSLCLANDESKRDEAWW